MKLEMFTLQYPNLGRTNQGSCCLQCWWRTASHLWGKTREQEQNLSWNEFIFVTCWTARNELYHYIYNGKSSGWPWKLPHADREKCFAQETIPVKENRFHQVYLLAAFSGKKPQPPSNHHPTCVRLPAVRHGKRSRCIAVLRTVFVLWCQRFSIPSSGSTQFTHPVLNVATFHPSFGGATLHILEAPGAGRSFPLWYLSRTRCPKVKCASSMW